MQAFEIRLIQSLLSAFEDPDWYFCGRWATGVWMGSPERKLARTLAVFDRKVKRRKLEATDELHGGWQRNYPSILEHADLVQKQFEAEYGPSLNIASTGAIAKKGRKDEVRVIYDGMHGLDLKPDIRVRDQVKFPTSGDGKELLAGCADDGGPHLSILVDIRKAHRRCAVLRKDWGRQACQIKESAAAAAKEALRGRAELARRDRESHGARATLTPRLRATAEDLPEDVLNEKVWLNKVGTFGVGSAGYWWGRAGACCCRRSHYMLGPQFMLWLLLYGDGEWLVGRRQHYYISLLLHMFFLDIVDTPIAWHKVCGGAQSDWVGYYVDVSRFEIGVSEARAAWAIQWLEAKARENTARAPVHRWAVRAHPAISGSALLLGVWGPSVRATASPGYDPDDHPLPGGRDWEEEDVALCRPGMRPGRGLQAGRQGRGRGGRHRRLAVQGYSQHQGGGLAFAAA